MNNDIVEEVKRIILNHLRYSGKYKNHASIRVTFTLGKKNFSCYFFCSANTQTSLLYTISLGLEGKQKRTVYDPCLPQAQDKRRKITLSRVPQCLATKVSSTEDRMQEMGGLTHLSDLPGVICCSGTVSSRVLSVRLWRPKLMEGQRGKHANTGKACSENFCYSAVSL